MKNKPEGKRCALRIRPLRQSLDRAPGSWHAILKAGMAKSTTVPPGSSNRPRSRPPGAAAAARKRPPVEVVDPRWLLKALAIMLALALICAQLLVCYVFYKTQWQYVLKPSRAVDVTPASRSLAFNPVRFGVDASGEPQLTGWWMPADPLRTGGSPGITALLLHGGDGSMSDALGDADALHQAGLNVLLFDYRGYGLSGGRHPSEALMEQDAASALSYLTSTRGLDAKEIVVFGTGAGASLAVHLCAQHAELPVLILENADGDFRNRVRHDPRVRVVPVGLLFDQEFALTGPLAHLATPKLLITTRTSTVPATYATARDPKTTAEIQSHDQTLLQQSIRRFLDTYLPAPPPTLTR